MLRVKRCKVRVNGITYAVGEILPSIPEADKKTLLKDGIVEEIEETSTIAEVEKPKMMESSKKNTEDNLNEENTESQTDIDDKEIDDAKNEELNIDLDLDDVVVEDDKKSKSKRK